MTALTWQTLLLLAIAYLAGCIIGFLARRRRGTRVDEEPARLPSQGEPGRSSSIGDAVTSALPLTAGTVAEAHPRAEIAPEPFRRADAPVQTAARPRQDEMKPAASHGPAPPITRFEQALSGADEQRAPTLPAPAVVRPQADPAPVAGDDLKRIRGISAELEARLRALGVHTYAQIAAWTAPEVARLSRELGFKGRIQQENWIEQAQVLAKGEETRFARRLARGEAAAASRIEDEGEPPTRPPVALVRPSTVATHAPSQPESSEDERDAAVAVASEESTPDTARGDHSRAETSAQQPASEPAVSERAAFASAQETADEAADAEAPPIAVASENTGIQPSLVAGPDNLQRIGDVNPEMERILNGQGVLRYSQIASWTPADVERFGGLVGDAGRIVRENWIEQAQILSHGGDTAYSREHDRRLAVAAGGEASGSPAEPETTSPEEPSPNDARPVRTSDVSALRSVRSQALLGSEPDGSPVPREGGAVRSLRSTVPDDLKRIRGIGVLIEKRLNAMGITAYEQLANWTATDIAHVSQTLDFKGRIERENWVEQARILASGGQTEFSRRVDRGEALSSRPH